MFCTLNEQTFKPRVHKSVTKKFLRGSSRQHFLVRSLSLLPQAHLDESRNADGGGIDLTPIP